MTIEEIKKSFQNFPTLKNWNKVKNEAGSGYGSLVTIIWGCEYLGYVDYGYLTCLVDMKGDWEELGVVHITYIDGDCMEGTDMQSLYSLCSNPLVLKIIIGPKP